jgi:hypothetical protein
LASNAAFAINANANSPILGIPGHHKLTLVLDVTMPQLNFIDEFK